MYIFFFLIYESSLYPFEIFIESFLQANLTVEGTGRARPEQTHSTRTNNKVNNIALKPSESSDPYMGINEHQYGNIIIFWSSKTFLMKNECISPVFCFHTWLVQNVSQGIRSAKEYTNSCPGKKDDKREIFKSWLKGWI